MNVKNIVKNNTKLFVIMTIIIILGTIGITLAINIESDPIAVNTTAGTLEANMETINYTSDSDTSTITSTGEMLPIDDSIVTEGGPTIENSRIIKAEFNVSGTSNNPANTIYDIALYATKEDIPCELRRTDLKWILYQGTTVLSQGNFSPTFDTMAGNRLVLTPEQEILTTTPTKYTFIMWISEACTGDISECDASLDQSVFLNKTINATLKIELSAKTTKQLNRITSSSNSCELIETEVPICNNLTYNGSSQTLVNENTIYTLNNNAAISAGKYRVIAVLNEGYKWSDGTVDNKLLTCEIDKKEVTLTTASQTITYGNSISTSLNQITANTLLTGHSLNKVTISPSRVDVGLGSVLASNAVIIDSSNNDVTNNYLINYNSGMLTINCLNTAAMPSTISTTKYTGEIKTGISGGTNVNIIGPTTATEVGEYTVTVEPQKNYCWSDNTTEAKTITWSITDSGIIIYLDNQISESNGTSMIYSRLNTYYTDKYYTKEMTTTSNNIITPQRVGYTFGGYYTGENGSGTQMITKTGYATESLLNASYEENTTLYASWNPKTYTIKYDMNGGTGTIENQEKSYGISITLSSYTPTKIGHKFLGWSLAANATSATYGPSSTFSLNANTTLYATWERTVLVAASSVDSDIGSTNECSSTPDTCYHKTFLGSDIYRDEIATLTFVDNNTVPSDVNGSINVSATGNPTVKMWYTQNDEGTYDVTIGSETEKLYIDDGSNLFWGLINVTSINFNDVVDTSYATTMQNMFIACKSLTTLDLNIFNTLNVTNMSYMFHYCESLETLNVSNFNTSNVTNMQSVFSRCRSLTALDISDWDTSNVTTMHSLFYYCDNLTTIDVSNWNTSSVTNMYGLFFYCRSLTTLNLDNFNTSKVTNMQGMFYNCGSLTTLDLSSFNTSNVTNMSNMFIYCRLLTTLDVSSFNTSKVTKMDNMFNNCIALTALDLSDFDTASVTTMSFMFYNCSSLTTLDVSDFNTSAVTTMDSMFYNCRNLTTLDVSNFNTSNVTNMGDMFYGCRMLTTLDVSNFNTEKVIYMYMMFGWCENLTGINLSNFDTSSVRSMANMFYFCTRLQTLDLSNFDTSNVTNMSYMFYNCNNLTSLNISSFDTSSVTNMGAMFYNCNNLISLDLSSFDTSNVEIMSIWYENGTESFWLGMFNACNHLETIYVSELWSVSSVATSNEMFKSCSALVGGSGTTYNASYIDATYARVDGGPNSDTPGYFTYKAAPTA